MAEDILEASALAPDEHAQNRGVVEALLVASDTPLSAARLGSVLSGVGAKEVRAYIDELNAEYADTGRSFRVVEVAGGFQFMVHPEYAPWVRQLLREKTPARLSQAALETLAIIAFKQPLTKTEVENIRGVAVDGVLRHLLEKGLIRIAGRADGPGRPLLYGSTRDFLKHFGLKTLSDLPKPRELDELMKDAEPGEAGGVQANLFGAEQPEAETGDEPEQGGEPSDGADGEGASEPVSGAGGGGVPEGE